MSPLLLSSFKIVVVTSPVTSLPNNFSQPAKIRTDRLPSAVKKIHSPLSLSAFTNYCSSDLLQWSAATSFTN